MEIQNSYIFLKKSSESSGKKLQEYIRESFSSLKRSRSGLNIFKQSYSGIIKINRKERTVSLLVHQVEDTYYVDVIAYGNTKSDIVNTLEYVQSVIYQSKIESDYIMIISYDAISEYYCNQMFPKLNELERNLRKLLFNIYTVNFGKDYYKAAISDELQNKAKGVIRAKGNENRKETEYIQKFFYSFEYGDIEKILFDKRWTELDEKNKMDFLKKHNDLSDLSDKELREAITDIAPKSDWERFFSDRILLNDIQATIEEIRKCRNNVAHCKFFYKSEHEKSKEIIDNFNQAILTAIIFTEDKDFADKNVDQIFNNLIIGLKTFTKVAALIVDSVSKSTPIIVTALEKFSNSLIMISENASNNNNLEEKELASNENNSE